VVIFIVVKFQVDPAQREQWPALTKEFTEATQAEPGNLWFDWSQSLADPNEYVLVEAFRDDDAGAAHVNSEHFHRGLAAMRPALTSTPKIIHAEIGAENWSPMGELEIISA
jgi:quinol monooxygenase YgiN